MLEKLAKIRDIKVNARARGVISIKAVIEATLWILLLIVGIFAVRWFVNWVGG